jgi:Cdc6-like AAA superfamily ATPase
MANLPWSVLTTLHFNDLSTSHHLGLKSTVQPPWMNSSHTMILSIQVGHTAVDMTSDASYDVLVSVKRYMSLGELPHLLFYGPAGTGKTSTILALAKQMYTPAEMRGCVLEVSTATMPTPQWSFAR